MAELLQWHVGTVTVLDKFSVEDTANGWWLSISCPLATSASKYSKCIMQNSTETYVFLKLTVLFVNDVLIILTAEVLKYSIIHFFNDYFIQLFHIP